MSRLPPEDCGEIRLAPDIDDDYFAGMQQFVNRSANQGKLSTRRTRIYTTRLDSRRSTPYVS